MIRDLIVQWAKKIGANEAKARIVRRGISGSAADKLIAGTYGFEPRGGNATVIIEEMAKDGFRLTNEAS